MVVKVVDPAQVLASGPGSIHEALGDEGVGTSIGLYFYRFANLENRGAFTKIGEVSRSEGVRIRKHRGWLAPKSYGEPRSWTGFFGYIDDGISPPSAAERLARLEVPQQPPSPDERSISDGIRAQWLIRHHMRQIGAFQIADRFPSPYLGQRQGEDLIGYYEEPEGSWWRVSSLDRGGLEMLRVDAQLLRDWKDGPL